jgi:hypothetical protein
MANDTTDSASLLPVFVRDLMKSSTDPPSSRPNLQAELGLTEEQARQLRALAQEQLDAVVRSYYHRNSGLSARKSAQPVRARIDADPALLDRFLLRLEQRYCNLIREPARPTEREPSRTMLRRLARWLLARLS